MPIQLFVIITVSRPYPSLIIVCNSVVCKKNIHNYKNKFVINCFVFDYLFKGDGGDSLFDVGGGLP